MFGFFEKKETHVDEVKAPAFVEWKGWRKFKVMNRKQECVDTTTFTLMPADEQPLPAFRAGQGVALRLEGFEPRAYTLCSTPDEGCYRITIKVLFPPSSPSACTSATRSRFPNPLAASFLTTVKLPS